VPASHGSWALSPVLLVCLDMNRGSVSRQLSESGSITAVDWDRLDAAAVSVSYRVAGSVVATASDPLSAYVLAITAGLAPPIVIATPRYTTAVSAQLTTMGCALCVNVPVDPGQVNDLRSTLNRRPAMVRFNPELHLLLDPLHHSARVRDSWLRLAPQEFALLYCLSLSETVVSTDALLREAWDGRSQRSKQAVEACVSQLRRKLARAGLGNIIVTVRDYGYRLLPNNVERRKAGD